MPGCVQFTVCILVVRRCLSVCVLCTVCLNFRGFIECEICTRPMSTNPGSMKAGEYGLTRGTCLVARLLEVVAVAGLLL